MRKILKFVLYLGALSNTGMLASEELDKIDMCESAVEGHFTRWSDARISLALKLLFENNFEFGSTSMRRQAFPSLDQLLTKKLGFPASVQSVYRRSVERYGTLQAALDENDIDYQIDVQHGVPSKWTKPLIKRALRTIYDNRYLPNVETLTKSRDSKLAEKVSLAVGFSTSLSSVYANAKRLYSNGLFDALEDADLPTKLILSPRTGTYWNKAAVKKGLKILFDTGYDVNSKALNKDKDLNANWLLTKHLGFSATTVMLYNYAVEYYGSLPAALKEAKLPVELILRHPPQSDLWTAEKVRVGLTALAQFGVEMSAKELKKPNRRNDQIVIQAVGFRTRTRVLLEKASEYFQSLQNALWTREMVKNLLRALYANNYIPNANFFETAEMDEKLKALILNTVGFAADRQSVYTQALRLFDNDFKKALRAAELPVDKIYHVRPSQPWTKDLIYRCLQALYAGGYKPKLHFLMTSKDERAKKIVNDITGFSTTLTTLLNKAREFHGGKFESALVEAKLPIDTITEVQSRTPWTKELTEIGLSALYESGYLPKATFLQKSDDPAAKKILVEAVGFETELSSLYIKTVEFHDNSFQDGVIAAGLPVEKIVAKFSSKGWTKKLSQLGLKVLYENGFRPNFTFLMHGQSEEAETLIKDALGFPATLSMLGRKVREFHHDDFTLALKEAGLPVDEIVYRKRPNQLTRKMISEGLNALFANGYLPNTGLLQSEDPTATHLLCQTLGFETDLKTLHDEAIKAYGPDLRDTLIALGLPANQITNRGPHRFWTRNSIIHILQMINAAGFTPYAPYLRRASNPILDKIISDSVGYPVRLSAVYVQAEGQFEGSFSNAIAAAGLSKEKIILRTEQPWSDELVLVALKALYENGFYPKYSALMSNNAEAQRIVSDSVGFLTTGRNLYREARNRFDSLRGALIKAGLPADEILNRMSRYIDYTVTMPIHRESVIENGEVHSLRYIGEAPLTPVEVALGKELREVTLAAIPPRLRSIGAQVIDVVFTFEVESITVNDIYLVLLKENPLVELSDVQSVMTSLQKNSEFRDYLLGR